MKKKRIRTILVNRSAIILPALFLQGVWFYMAYRFFLPLKPIADSALSLLAVGFVLYLVSKPYEPTYKMMWVIIMLVFPVLGAAMYIIFGNKATGKPLKKRLSAAREIIGEPPRENCLNDGKSNIETIGEKSPRIAGTLGLIEKISGFSVLKNDFMKYYPSGEEMFADYINELKSAEKFIYMEYFIIEGGDMWDTVLDILSEKAADGIDVRLIYDDLGCIGTLPAGYFKKLRKKNIKCHKFNPFILALTGRLNNRDHRKITVIDGKTAFSGGINIADEYINKSDKFGYWKDVGYMIKGEGTDAFLYMFAEFWDAFEEDKIPEDILKNRNSPCENNDGYILPYYDSPMRKYPASMTLFSEILSRAEKYAWFCTPYLMINDELYSEFMRAAERGADVRIIMPGIPDKRLVFAVSRSYYGQLLEAGVKIYEFSPGFVHAKICISDDIIGAAGSVNLDYRSLFLHFECNTALYDVSCLSDIKKDFIETMEKCRVISPETHKGGMVRNIINGILRLIAPLF